MKIYLNNKKMSSFLSRISYLTTTLPYFMIVALIVNGLTLPGARNGIEYYILKIDFNKLASLKVGFI